MPGAANGAFSRRRGWLKGEEMQRTYTYYPGCSLEATSCWYDRSLRAVAPRLDMELRELEDWNCCGATAYMSVRELMSFCVAARNLALAEPAGFDLDTPCSACFTVLTKANRYFQETPELKGKIETALAAAGLKYRGTVRVRHILDVVANDVGVELLRERTTRHLGGLKVAPYYGCQVVRPRSGFDSPDYPQSLDRVLAAVGAEPVEFPLKARCCGASLIVTKEEAAHTMIAEILRCAREAGAEAIATLCPLCHVNLETQMERLSPGDSDGWAVPVLFFTQLLGAALGVEEAKLGFEASFVDPRPLLERRMQLVG